jgi:hypothetical protein
MDDSSMDLIVEFQDIYDSSNMVRVPLVKFQSLGYEPKDILALRPNALDLILEGDIRKPENKGLPKRWLRVQDPNDPDNDEKLRVRILKRRRKMSEPREPTHNREKRTTNIPRNEPREEPLDDDDDDDEFTMPKPRYTRDRKSRNVRDRRLENNRDNIPDDISNSKNRFWMDLPTFKKYLRKEAQMRLSILGSDWRDWVRGESDWRYQLYKTWLEVLDGGIGDDMFDDVSEARRPFVRTPSNKRNGSRRSKRSKDRYRKDWEDNDVDEPS